MRLISFDVGIKNLAYCVFSFAPDKSTWNISQWSCANLLWSPETVTRTCCQAIKAKKKTDTVRVCGKHAKWIAPTKDSEFAYCETHAKMHTDEWILPTAKHSASRIHKLKKDELETEYRRIFSDTEKLKKSDYADKILQYYETKCFRSTAQLESKSKSAGEVDLVTIGRAIKMQLDSDPSISDITHVIIENQISTIASRMKTIQGMIAQYFIMRFGNKVDVEFVSSQNKLKGFQQPMPDTATTKYKANKSDGIVICRQFFETNGEMFIWKDTFERSKKRDDLADCFLQGVWYLKANKIIYYAEDLKINSVFVS
jgi:hypothetical protein